VRMGRNWSRRGRLSLRRRRSMGISMRRLRQ
jgi:hypothetical protein